MATKKAPKKKSASTKKPVSTLKKKTAGKKISKDQVKKKVLKKKEKPMMKAVKPSKEFVPPKSKDDLEEFRKVLVDMREKLLAGISENPIPEALSWLARISRRGARRAMNGTSSCICALKISSTISLSMLDNISVNM